MSLIDRDKLIEELEKKKEIESKRCQYMADLGLSEYVEKYNHGEYCYLESMRIANEQPTVNQWIPCLERLPKKPLFSWDGYIVQKSNVTEPFSAYWDGEKWTNDEDDEIEGIIAWQPLPTPYEE